MAKRKRTRTRQGYNAMGQMKENIAVGVGSMAGMGVMGAMSSMPGVPVGSAAPIMTGLGLLNVGQLAKTGMGLAGSMGSYSNKKKSKSKFM